MRPNAGANDAGSAPEDGRTIIQNSRSGEIFLAVVGPVGAGASRACDSLERACTEAGYEPVRVKVSQLIREWAESNNRPEAGNLDKIDKVEQLQNLGDAMRLNDPTRVARAVLVEIAQLRAKATGTHFQHGSPVTPGKEKIAYIIDSIRHPAETNLFRRTYANAFALVGVVCEEEERKQRIFDKFFPAADQSKKDLIDKADKLIRRDASDDDKDYGQHVTKAFYEADYFVDNTAQDLRDNNQLLDEPLARLVNIIAHEKIIRPTIEETAMHHAHSARVRSACLSRQVGAALVDRDGTIIATGANEVPRAGGGVYGERNDDNDHRCAFQETPYCSSNREQNRIIDELIEAIEPLRNASDKTALIKQIRNTPLGQLIEFSRAVHAEMDALLSAGREGFSTVGTRLFVTTFPCHYCARHIVSAGVYEVQFIEPYPKSLALSLHKDAIITNAKEWHPPEEIGMAEAKRRRDAEKKEISSKEPARATPKPGQVLFSPFVGVAPRLYLRAFEETRKLKNKTTGDLLIQKPEWGDEWSQSTVSYSELEALLTKSLQ